jgi:hypothetical protein
MSTIFDHSGVPSPPLSEDGSSVASGCPISEASPRAQPEGVNNSAGHSPFCLPSPPRSIKARRDRTSLQREANRSRQFTNRLQRSATTNGSGDLLLKGKLSNFRRQTTSLSSDSGLKAVEPPHDQLLTKMAFAEQQQWITVQQKTFTKW